MALTLLLGACGGQQTAQTAETGETTVAEITVGTTAGAAAGTTAGTTVETAAGATEAVPPAENAAGAPAEETAAEASGPELAADSILRSLPACEQAVYAGWREMGDGAEMLVYEDSAAESFHHYEEQLAGAGFEKYDGSEMAGNLYSTWTDGETTASLIYMPEYGSFRIVAESAGELAPREEDNPAYETVCEPLMEMVSVNFNGGKSNGMCFLYRLSDGSFILVDGGFNQEPCADAIYNEMKKLAPDPEHIVIAAWFMTHSHPDHYAVFKKFSQKYAGQVTLESCVYNYPAAEDGNVETVEKGVKAMTEHLPLYGDKKVIEAHPGQRYYIRDAVIEMLYTWEQLVPYDKVVAEFNDTSLVFSIELGGEKIMQLGDCGTSASVVVETMYKDYLKSDIMQVAHHGLLGASEGLNTYIAAEVACWPTTQYGMEQRAGNTYNKPLKNAAYTYVAGDCAVRIPLPFDPEQVVQEPIYFR